MRPDIEAYRRRAAEVLGEAYQRGIQARGRLETRAVNTLISAAESGRYELVDPNNYLEEAKDRTFAGESGIIYFGPHYKGFPPDVALVGKVTERIVPLTETAVFTAKKQMDPDRGRNRFSQSVHRAEFNVINRASQELGFTTIPIVQTEDEAYYLDHMEAIGGMTPRRFSYNAVNVAAEFLLGTIDNPIGGRLLVIAANGTRDPRAKLERAHSGLEWILKKIRKNGFAMGIALEPNVRRSVPILGSTKVIITKLLTWEDVTDKYEALQKAATVSGQKLGFTRSDLMMVPIAGVLRPSRQGNFYKDMLLRFPELADPASW